MHIRLVKISDIEKIVSLGKKLLVCHQNFDSEYYQFEPNFDELFFDWAKNHINHPTQFILVAQDDFGEICGFLSGFIKVLYPWFRVKKVGHVAYLIVDDAFQKMGIGAQLENQAVLWFQEKKVPFIEVYTDSLNEIGKHVWDKYGYDDFKKFLRKKI